MVDVTDIDADMEEETSSQEDNTVGKMDVEEEDANELKNQVTPYLWTPFRNLEIGASPATKAFFFLLLLIGPTKP